MKKLSLFLISITVLCGAAKLLLTSKAKSPFFDDRDQEILNLIALGYGDNEIARLFHTSVRRILKYQLNILRKMNLHNISSAMEYALDKGLVRIAYG
jgi:DNA-binding NarL/FixJ family response regulator